MDVLRLIRGYDGVPSAMSGAEGRATPTSTDSLAYTPRGSSTPAGSSAADALDLTPSGSSAVMTAAKVGAAILLPLGLAWWAISSYQSRIFQQRVEAALRTALDPSGETTPVTSQEITSIARAAINLWQSNLERGVLPKNSSYIVRSGCFGDSTATASAMMVKTGWRSVMIIPNHLLGGGITRLAFPGVQIDSAQNITQYVIGVPNARTNGAQVLIKEAEKARLVKSKTGEKAALFAAPAETLELWGQVLHYWRREEFDLSIVGSKLSLPQLRHYPTLILKALISCLKAMIALFEVGLVHSDIKPPNVFISCFGMCYPSKVDNPHVTVGDLECVAVISEKKEEVARQKARIEAHLRVHEVLAKFDCQAQFIRLLGENPQERHYYINLTDYERFLQANQLVSETRIGEISAAFSVGNQGVLTLSGFWEEYLGFLLESNLSPAEERVMIMNRRNIPRSVAAFRKEVRLLTLFRSNKAGLDYYPSTRDYISFLEENSFMSKSRYEEFKSRFSEGREGELAPEGHWEALLFFLLTFDKATLTGTDSHISARYARERFPNVESDLFALGETMELLRGDMERKKVSLWGFSTNTEFSNIIQELKSGRLLSVADAKAILARLERLLSYQEAKPAEEFHSWPVTPRSSISSTASSAAFV